MEKRTGSAAYRVCPLNKGVLLEPRVRKSNPG